MEAMWPTCPQSILRPGTQPGETSSSRLGILHRNPTQEPPLSPLQGTRAQRTEGPVQASGRLGTTRHPAQSQLAVS